VRIDQEILQIPPHPNRRTADVQSVERSITIQGRTLPGVSFCLMVLRNRTTVQKVGYSEKVHVVFIQRADGTISVSEACDNVALYERHLDEDISADIISAKVPMWDRNCCMLDFFQDYPLAFIMVHHPDF